MTPVKNVHEDGGLPDTSAVIGKATMTSSLSCAECSHPPFTGPAMWNAYGRHLRTKHPGPSGLEARFAAARVAIDRFGWHLSDCPAYEGAAADGPASVADDVRFECTCEFRAVIEALL